LVSVLFIPVLNDETQVPAGIVVLLLCKNAFCAGCSVVHAWASGADQRDLSFGFTFQYVSTDFKIAKKPDWRSPFYDPQRG
jgi:hypothetical protein